jgi:hypothetical protein
VGLVQKIVEHLAAIDYGKVNITKLHVARIVPRCAPRRRADARFRPRSMLMRSTRLIAGFYGTPARTTDVLSAIGL